MIHFIVNTLDSDYSDLILFILLLILWTPTLACPAPSTVRSHADPVFRRRPDLVERGAERHRGR